VEPPIEPPSDDELVTAWRSGDSKAGNRLIERYKQNLWRFFSNKVTDSPEDLVQQTVLACLESIFRYERRSSFRVFLFGIARNVLYHHYRDRNAGFDPLTSSVLSLKTDSASPMGYVSEREESRLLLRVLRELPMRMQVLVELHYWEGLSNRELAEIEGIPMGTVKSWLRKARAEIRQRLALASDPGSSPPEEPGPRSLESWAEAVRNSREE
jgi:RNA polymerase sigma factor (sigma-70 family)